MGTIIIVDSVVAVMAVALAVLAVCTVALAILCLRQRRRLAEARRVVPEPCPCPVAEPTDEPCPDGESQEDSPSILVVTADAALGDELERKLCASFGVLRVRDGNEGLERAGTCSPDIVIADVMTPGLSGYELCARLRASVATSHIAIILVSAFGERESVIYGLQAGADDFIMQPFDMATLRSRIQVIMQRHLSYRACPLTPGSLGKADYKSKLDRQFMDKVMAVIAQRMADSGFTINDLCLELAMSRSSLFNKVKALTGKGPNEVIKAMRLNKARELLLTRELTVSEVAFKVGYSDPKYFSTCFKKQFGISPNKV